MRRYHRIYHGYDSGATYNSSVQPNIGATPAPARANVRLTAQAQGVLNTMAVPVRWGFSQASSLAHFIGNTLQKVGNSL